jgi:hypothetical protein
MSKHSDNRFPVRIIMMQSVPPTVMKPTSQKRDMGHPAPGAEAVGYDVVLLVDAALHLGLAAAGGYG